MKYLSQLAVDPKTERFARRCVQKGMRRGFFTAERRFLGQYYRREILSGAVGDVEVGDVDEQIGKGLFAARDFAPWEYLGAYTGVLKRRDLLCRNSNDYCFSYPCGCWSPRPLMVDAQDQGNEMRYINHCEEANVEVLGVPIDGLVHLLVRTSKGVPAGTQLVLDYGPFYWRKGRPKPLKVSC